MKRFQTYLSGLLTFLLLATLGACTDDDNKREGVYLETDAPYYSANARGLTYNGEEVVVHIRSNTYWVISYDKGAGIEEPWFSLSQEAGNGDMDLAVTLLRNDGGARSIELKIITNRNVSQTVTLSQAGIGEVVYFYGDDLGTGSAGTPVTEFDGWNLRGMGVEETYYDGQNATVDNGSASSTYDGASGGNNVLLGENGWLTLGSIATKGDYNFIFSFGVSNDVKTPSVDDLKLYISQDRAQWTPVKYTLATSADQAGKWSMVRVPFFIKEDCPAVFFRFESASAGYRIDDPALEEGDGTGETIVFKEDIVSYIKTVLWEDDFSWADNPAYVKSDAWTGSDGTRIDRWANYPESTNGWTIESGRATSYPRSAGSASQTGYLKSGWADGGAGLFSPAMGAIKEESLDVTVELTLAIWTMNNKPDNKQLRIRVLNAGTIENETDTEKVFAVESLNEWSVYEFKIFGATAATQIYIGSTLDANNRWFIDRFRLIHITEKPGDFEPELTTDPTSLEFATAGESKPVQVTSNGAWSVRSDAEWLSFAPGSGDAGTSTLAITAERNQTGAERPATVEFIIDGEVITTLGVTQDGTVTEYAPSPTGLTVLNASATVLTYSWEAPENTTGKYQTALFTDKEADPVQESPEFVLAAKYPATVFTFAGLEPSTTYHLAVRTISTTSGIENSPYIFLESRTTVAQTAPDALLAMYFDRLKWCGDHMFKSYGLRPKGVGGSTAPDAKADDLTNANTGGSSDVFNTHNDAFRADRQVSDWYGLRAYEYPGYIKLGTASQAGFIVTPKLSGLSESGDVRISFRLGNWNEPNADGTAFDIDKAVIRVGIVPENVTNDNLKSWANASSPTLMQNITFTAEEAPVSAIPQTWTDVSVQVPGVKPTDRLIIYATVDGTEAKGKARYEVDEIVVTKADVPPVTTIFEDTLAWVNTSVDWANKLNAYKDYWEKVDNRVYAKYFCLQFGTGTYEAGITSLPFTSLGATPAQITLTAELTGNAANKKSVNFQIIGAGSFSPTEDVTTTTVQLDGFMPNVTTATGEGFEGWETKTLTVYGADQTTQIRLACVKVDNVTQQFWLNSFRATK
ncbi:BACON domain-containing carbohydrate-binding protein [uncultured Alistipes sp.]|jgi:hypothetical protein|uniref:BACON domain-containing protein n=1 Tax=uncultured Alistipes sp. TaxID=538949 RepID=UPI0025D326ED|nr:BACON domain-containing carbohydrate-binding protein [uncultured Alistipes sp.]